MFGHDRDEDDKNKDQDNLIHPVDNKPVDEKLMGVSDDDKEDVVTAPADDDKDIEDIVKGINATVEEPEDNSDADKSQDSGKGNVPSVDESPASDNASVDGDLMNIKKSALEELSPLIDKLDQSPEEKTTTLLMMIQATDDQSRIPDAFKAAKDIADEKKRAQAMLDIINEINYFTSKNK